MAKVLIEEADLNAIAAAHSTLTKVLAGIQVEHLPTGGAEVVKPNIGGILPRGYKLSEKSLTNMSGVDHRLVACVKVAITKTLQDFTVYEGLRTKERQRRLVDKGASRTMQSKHIVGLAIDLVPWINGAPVWDWDGCAKIAFAMDQSATQLGIADKITWGGAWDRRLSDYGGKLELYMQEVEKYKQRHEGSDFIDGPHFEILP